jgi:hypothetical protein
VLGEAYRVDALRAAIAQPVTRGYHTEHTAPTEPALFASGSYVCAV